MEACYQSVQVTQTKTCTLDCILGCTGGNCKWDFCRVLSVHHSCLLRVESSPPLPCVVGTAIWRVFFPAAAVQLCFPSSGVRLDENFPSVDVCFMGRSFLHSMKLSIVFTMGLGQTNSRWKKSLSMRADPRGAGTPGHRQPRSSPEPDPRGRSAVSKGWHSLTLLTNLLADTPGKGVLLTQDVPAGNSGESPVMFWPAVCKALAAFPGREWKARR